MLVVDYVGRGRGLALMWKEDLGIEIQNYSQRHINAIVKQANGIPWTFTGFYGHPEAHKRTEAWGLLRFLKSLAPGLWICACDFNEILDLSEKLGGKGRPNFLMENFKNTLNFCDLKEIDCRGPVYTWNNGKEDEEFIRECLDRVVVNSAWRNIFPNGEASIELAINSDHLPIVIQPHGIIAPHMRKKMFRYEAGWAEKEDCKILIKKIWMEKESQQGTWQSVRSKLNKSKGSMLQWQRVQGQQPEKRIQQLSKQILSLQEESGAMDVAGFHKLHVELSALQEKEDLHWRQRAKEEWLKFGDRNSKFFHAYANQKRKASMINQISDESGQV